MSRLIKLTSRRDLCRRHLMTFFHKARYDQRVEGPEIRNIRTLHNEGESTTISSRQRKNFNCCVKLSKKQLIGWKLVFNTRAIACMRRRKEKEQPRREFRRRVGGVELCKCARHGSDLEQLMVCICFSPNRSILSASRLAFFAMISQSWQSYLRILTRSNSA